MADRDTTSFSTPLAQGAAQTHEMFRSYVDAGFTERQALYLIGQMLAAAVAKRPGSTPDA